MDDLGDSLGAVARRDARRDWGQSDPSAPRDLRGRAGLPAPDGPTRRALGLTGRLRAVLVAAHTPTTSD